MLSIELITLKTSKPMQTHIVVDFEQNSQVLSQNPIVPITFKIDSKNRKKALKFSYRIFDERSVLIDSADADLSNSLLLFDTLLLENQPKELIIKNKSKNCEITFKTIVLCDLNAVLIYENIKNDVRKRIQRKGKKEEIKANIVDTPDLQIMELNQSNNKYPTTKTNLEKSKAVDNQELKWSKLNFTKFSQSENLIRVGDFFKEITIKSLYKGAISCFSCCTMRNVARNSEVALYNLRNIK